MKKTWETEQVALLFEFMDDFFRLLGVQWRNPGMFAEMIYNMNDPLMGRATNERNLPEVHQVDFNVFQKSICNNWPNYWFLAVTGHNLLLLVAFAE